MCLRLICSVEMNGRCSLSSLNPTTVPCVPPLFLGGGALLLRRSLIGWERCRRSGRFLKKRRVLFTGRSSMMYIYFFQ